MKTEKKMVERELFTAMLLLNKKGTPATLPHKYIFDLPKMFHPIDGCWNVFTFSPRTEKTIFLRFIYSGPVEQFPRPEALITLPFFIDTKEYDVVKLVEVIHCKELPELDEDQL